MTVNALVDTGAYMLVITDLIREQLDLPLIEEQLFRMADDSERRGEVVGPVECASKTDALQSTPSCSREH